MHVRQGENYEAIYLFFGERDRRTYFRVGGNNRGRYVGVRIRVGGVGIGYHASKSVCDAIGDEYG
jgi:hypothetical protein